MIFSNEVQDEIREIFKEDVDFMNRLLEGDKDSISSLAVNNMISPEDVVDAYKENNIEKIYKDAIFKLRKKKLYFKMIEEYARVDTLNVQKNN